MSNRSYLVISGALFGCVALLHLLRVINGWGVVVGPWRVPMWVSWAGTVVPALLSVWAIRSVGRNGT